MGFGKTHKLYKKYLYSLWVLTKPINYTKNTYIVYGFYTNLFPESLKFPYCTNIFVVFMGFTKTHKLYKYFLYSLWVLTICIGCR